MRVAGVSVVTACLLSKQPISRGAGPRSTGSSNFRGKHHCFFNDQLASEQLKMREILDSLRHAASGLPRPPHPGVKVPRSLDKK